MSEAVLATLVAGGFSVLVALLERSRRENNRDHNINYEKLTVIADQQETTNRILEKVENKVDTHINDHARGIL
jgi:hypothetical protein